MVPLDYIRALANLRAENITLKLKLKEVQEKEGIQSTESVQKENEVTDDLWGADLFQSVECTSKAVSTLPLGYKLPTPTTLAHSGTGAILKFTKSYQRYVTEGRLLERQGARFVPVPIRSCIKEAVLQSICRWDLLLKPGEWRSVSDNTLAAYLWKKRTQLTNEDRKEAAFKIKSKLSMTYVGGTASIEDAARKMFEQLMELLDDMEDVLSEKKQCSLIIDALKPVELQRAVKQRIEEHDDCYHAKKSVNALVKLVINRAKACDDARSLLWYDIGKLFCEWSER